MNKFYISFTREGIEKILDYVHDMHGRGTVLSHDGKFAKNVAIHLFINES